MNLRLYAIRNNTRECAMEIAWRIRILAEGSVKLNDAIIDLALSADELKQELAK